MAACATALLRGRVRPFRHAAWPGGAFRLPSRPRDMGTSNAMASPRSRVSRFTLADRWLDRPPADEPPARELVLRYLTAFGPASAKDIKAWSGMTRLREVVESLRPRWA
ncbi:DNA glycosylase AlkZ-like family protein [Streptosporangium sp. NPDC050284]|uniref:DNA glycosylase AlkZ-like family protein n=1 Tax=Streptosporangium sp. NPDC050284 TaxID=3366193 RepID=UPI003789407F